MTEAEWAACGNPELMLHHLGERASARKLRLYAAACCRRVWPFLHDARSRRAVVVAEQFADDRADVGQLVVAHGPACEVVAYLQTRMERTPDGRGYHTPAHEAVTRPQGPLPITPDPLAVLRFAARAAAEASNPTASEFHDHPAWKAAWNAAWGAAWDARIAARDGLPGADWEGERRRQADLLRELFGPTPHALPPLPPAVLAWNDATVPRLARHIDEERAFERLPLLADALLDAGCDQDPLIAHCRSPGPHALGCWAVDLVRSVD